MEKQSWILSRRSDNVAKNKFSEIGVLSRRNKYLLQLSNLLFLNLRLKSFDLKSLLKVAKKSFHIYLALGPSICPYGEITSEA